MPARAREDGRNEGAVQVKGRVGSACRWMAVVLAAQALGQVVVASPCSAAPVPESGPRTEVVARLAVGAGQGEVGVEEGAEGRWGVSSFAIGPDGDLYIVDGVNDKVVVVDSAGAFEREIALPEPLIGPDDVAVTKAGVYLLDTATQPGVVVRLAEDGSIAQSWTVPEEYAVHPVTGIEVQDTAGEDVYLEIAASWSLPFVEDGRAVRPRPLPLVRRGNTADVPVSDAAAFGLRRGKAGTSYCTRADWTKSDTGTVAVFEHGRRVRDLVMRGSGELLGLKALDTRGDRDFVSMSQLAPDGRPDPRVVSFRNAAPEASFRIPSTAGVTAPNKNLRVTEDGSVLCLVPAAEELTVQVLPAEDVPAPTRAEAVVKAETKSVPTASRWSAVARMVDWFRAVLAPRPTFAAWTRLNASDRAWSYVNLKWYCSSANYSRSCGDYRPSYITSSGKSYTSVPYCWGGGDLPSEFTTDMKNGLDAGDVNCTGGKRSCTSGVDCSGLVSRMWGIPKHGTSTLLDHCDGIEWSQLKVADCLLKPDHHAIAFNYFTSTHTAVVWESTTTSDKDRVVSWTRDTADLDAAQYRPVRYEYW